MNFITCVTNVLIVLLAAISIYFKLKLRLLTRSHAFFWIIAALVWVFVVRVAVAVWPGFVWDTEAVLGFWVLFTIGAYVMWRDMDRFFKGDDR